MFDHPDVREDLLDAYRETWDRLGRAGTFWTAAERVAMAQACRDAWICALCRRRKAALSPRTVDGEHDGASDLAPSVVDVVHRITTDSARLTKAWFDGIDLEDGPYVELLGVVTTVVSVDRWHETMGLPRPPLPDPQPGEPTRERPEALKDIGAWVPVLDHRRADLGPALRRIPLVPNVVLALSLVPAELRGMLRITAAQYLSPMALANVGGRTGRALERPQMEFIAARVSSINQCFY